MNNSDERDFVEEKYNESLLHSLEEWDKEELYEFLLQEAENAWFDTVVDETNY